MCEMESLFRICRDSNPQAIRAEATRVITVHWLCYAKHPCPFPCRSSHPKIDKGIKSGIANSFYRSAKHPQCASKVRPSQPELLANSNQDVALVNQEIRHQGRLPANTCSCTPSRWLHDAQTPHCRSVLCCCLTSALCSPGQYGKLAYCTGMDCHCSLGTSLQAGKLWSLGSF